MQKEHDNEETPEMTDEPVTEETIENDVEFEESNEDGEVDMRGTVKKLREKVKKLEEEKKEYLDLSQRTRADYMNFKKEVEQGRATDRKFATKRLITDLLPVLDAYDMAQGNKEAWEAVDKNWRIGIEYIFNQLHGVLEKEGVVPFADIGEEFDPAVHESMEHVPVEDEKENNKIVQVLQKGYKMGDTVLRPARVKTGEYKK
jgi:molecular chaperone GrpE